jgi:hypothetical protein
MVPYNGPQNLDGIFTTGKFRGVYFLIKFKIGFLLEAADFCYILESRHFFGLTHARVDSKRLY